MAGRGQLDEAGRPTWETKAWAVAVTQAQMTSRRMCAKAAAVPRNLDASDAIL